MIYKLSVFIDKSIFKLRNALGFSSDLEKVLGIRVGNKALFETALSHKSVGATNYERLEFLGDAVLESVVSDYIFKKYKTYREGQLTVLRSKIVRRKQLNTLAKQLGLDNYVLILQEAESRNLNTTRILGDTLEAVIGAIYIDSGYYSARYFVINKLFENLMDLDEIDEDEFNYKGRLIEWSQREKQLAEFRLMDDLKRKGRDFFIVGLYIEDNLLATGEGFSKRSAEHLAAKRALTIIEDTNDEQPAQECELL